MAKAQAQMYDMFGYMWNNRETIRDTREIGDKLPGEVIQVWRGSAKHIATHFGLSMSMTYKILRFLATCGCVEMVRHGGAGTNSIYKLIRQPTIDEYENLKERSHMTGRTEPVTQIQKVQDSVNRIHSIVVSLEDRVKRLETR